MPLTCPAEVDLTRLRNSVHLIYARVALEPSSVFSFHRGADYACRCLGYDRDTLMTLPAEVTSCFAGVGNPLRAGPLRPGEIVADLGCGSGTDLLLAARAVGPGGRAIGIDINESMRERAERGARRGGYTQVRHPLRRPDRHPAARPQRGRGAVQQRALSRARTRIARSRKSRAFFVRAGGCTWPTWSSIARFRRRRAATSRCGRAASRARSARPRSSRR